ncbi:hypothetical protein C4559_02270 [Candidatus Microgenomates bacterium]|nr:MAG: hypothetical protein C4559_02270 [Candidatus Microgenomates bacterium]
MSSEEGSPKQRKIEKYPRSRFGKEAQKPSQSFFAPIERKIIGGTPVIDGKQLSAKDFEGLAQRAVNGDKEAERKLFTPEAVWQKSKSSEKIREEREQKGNKTTDGIFGPLSEETYSYLLLKDLHLRFELSPLDENGYVLPYWKVFLINSKKDFVSDNETLEKLSTKGNLFRFGGIQEDGNGVNYRVLLFGPEKK